MREIKFRAWWVTDKIMLNQVQDFYDTLGDKEHGNKYEPEQSFGQVLDQPEEYKVMQYTGLKDKNGKEIYEGDILKHPKSDEVFVVDWSNAYSGFKAFYQDDDCYSGSTLVLQINEKGLAEVIGNIHENPELLEDV